MLLDTVVFPFGLQKWRKGNMTKNIDLTTVGGRLKSKRIAMGYTQEELAEELMIKANMISGYEGNKVNIPLNALQQLAKVLCTSVSYLADGIECTLSSDEKELLALFNSLKNDQLKKVALGQLKALTLI